MKNASPIIEMLSAEYGLEITKTVEQEIEKAAEALLRGKKVPPEKLWETLESDAEALKRIVSSATVAETYFFRHAEHFSEIVELFGRNLARGSTASFWSAGCSSGEEAYSLAMSLVEAFGWQALESAHIFGSDISEESVAKAKAGVYSRWSFRDAPQSYKERFFNKASEREGVCSAFKIDERLRNAVVFETSSIQSRLRRTNDDSIDAIMFRNVGIYMRNDALENLFSGFCRVLKKGGLLIVAPADPRPDLPVLKRTNHKSTSVYVKSDSDENELEAARREERFYPVEVKLEPEFESFKPVSFAVRDVETIAPEKTELRILKSAAGEDQTSNAAQKAQALCGRGEYAKALEIADELIQTNPDSASSYILRGQIYYAQEMFDEAAENFRRAVYLSPEDPLARYWQALTQRDLGLFAQSRNNFEHCINLLSKMEPNDLLSDDVTTVKDLLKAVEFSRTALA